MSEADPVKSAVAAHWNRRAANFDDDFGHSIATPAERAAWDRILGLIVAGRGALDALDAGCGTGFLCFELAARGHRATGIDFAESMLQEARRKAAENRLAVRFEQGDAENLRFAAQSFDLVVSRHVLWTLPHPQAAVAEWIRMLRPGGRLAVIDSQFDAGALSPQRENARASNEYAAISDKLPFLGGRPREEIEALFKSRGLVDVGSDPVADLVAAQAERMAAEGREPTVRRRYVAWGNVSA
jgi:ubiquinone/menaquinone biosynthesis C-methylase UbiE